MVLPLSSIGPIELSVNRRLKPVLMSLIHVYISLYIQIFENIKWL